MPFPPIKTRKFIDLVLPLLFSPRPHFLPFLSSSLLHFGDEIMMHLAEKPGRAPPFSVQRSSWPFPCCVAGDTQPQLLDWAWHSAFQVLEDSGTEV